MALHIYMSEEVDTAIIECGIGGEYDSTNIIVSPTVTGITSLGIDHVAMLGKTIEEIAWHKAGIMKSGAPAFTVPQPPSAYEVLQQRAAAKPVTLEVVEPDLSLRAVPLGLAGDFQVSNASLAVRVASAHLVALGLPATTIGSPLSEEFLRGLREVRWPGRCEARHEKNIIWHIDSAHTPESIQAAAAWFVESLVSTTEGNPPNPNPSISTSPRLTRILLFNQQTRDADAFSRSLFTTISNSLNDSHPFSHVVFCTNQTFEETGFRPDLISLNSNHQATQALEVQRGLTHTWGSLDSSATVNVVSSINEAVQWVRNVARTAAKAEAPAKTPKLQVPVLVTGSVHLVGRFLEILETTGIADGDAENED